MIYYRKLCHILILLFIIACSAMFHGCAVRMPAKDAELAEIVSELEKRAYIVQRFRASFIKTKHSSLFEKDLKVEGALVFNKPNQFRLITNGDISIKVVSDGRIISLIHDNKDEEIYRLQGDRDTARFADPLMLLVDSIGKGAFHKFGIEEQLLESGETLIEIDPKNVTSFERVNRAIMWLDPTGKFKRIRILYENGNWDETMFLSWSILSEESPEMKELNQEIRDLKERYQDEESRDSTPRFASNSSSTEDIANRASQNDQTLPFSRSHQPGWHLDKDVVDHIGAVEP